jgi:eukaryotic-like serine/threonine-protein kinase
LNNILRLGDLISLTPSGQKGNIETFLGSGGQGEVYKVRINSEEFALKCYYPEAIPDNQKALIERLIRLGQPNNKFLWPLSIVEGGKIPGFGYVMQLRPNNYKNIIDLMKRRIDPTFYSIATACMELSDSFLSLHAKGLCYRDISFGNAFFNPDNGEILICDNDNVIVDGEDFGGILGTPRFMAPEIVIGDAHPNSDTDRFSLAVLMFYLLILNHPLEGKKESLIHCLDLPAMRKIYGQEAVFIFDPNNDTNRPDPNYHQNAIVFWSLYPKYIQDLFIKSFTKGLHVPEERVRESVWRNAMAKLRDSIFLCWNCGAENFYDNEKIKNGLTLGQCWNCKKDLKLPPRILIDNSQIKMLNANTQLFPHHLDPSRQYDFETPLAEVSQHPSNPNIWGLKNLSNNKWIVDTGTGQLKELEPSKSVIITSGLKIQFGTSEGEIKI